MEPEDSEVLFLMENDPSNWQYSRQSEAPYTMADIARFVRRSPRDIVSDGQLRFIISPSDTPRSCVGAVDLYDYNAVDRSAWVAILVYPARYRGCGVARGAFEQLFAWCASKGVERLYAQIDAKNSASRKFFEAVGFSSTCSVSVESGDVLYFRNIGT